MLVVRVTHGMGVVSMNPIVQVVCLKKHFPMRGGKTVYAVDGVSFDLNKRETLGLVGESGSGKSTVARCMVQLVPPTEGDILFNGQNLVGLSEARLKSFRRQMQIIFQDPYGSLTPRMRISSLLSEPLEVHGVGNKAQRKEMVVNILQKVGLKSEHMNRYPHEFSGGQRQRISIARALMLNPKVLIADEPVSALDVSIRAQILNLLVDLQKDFDLSYLFVSHDLSVIKYMCERIMVMYLGRIVEVAPKDILFSDYQHPYTTALISAIPVPAVREKRQRVVLQGDVPNPSKPPSGCKFHTRCQYKCDLCEKEEPLLKTIGEGHSVACHLR
jgi:oligopeptide transport system ATP-binding protein